MQAWLVLVFAAMVTAMPQPLMLVPPTAPSKPPFRIRRSLPAQKRANRLITVVVGGTQDTFVPNSVQAAVGDVIQFQFSSGNHTVTQSSEDAPCQPLQLTNPEAIHSGHIPYEAGQTTVGTFNMPVTSTDPTFLYCATGPHCQNGQVMVVNPTSDEQLLNYSKLSSAAAANVDGTDVVGGTVGEISLDTAAFNPPVEEEPAPPDGAPPGGAPAESSTETPAEAPTEAPAETPAAAHAM